jgi:hypothetical protein
LGVLALHPFAMIVCQLSGMLDGGSVAGALIQSFSPSMYLMWIFYGLLGTAAGGCAALLVNRIRLIEGFAEICAWCGRIHAPGRNQNSPQVWKRLDEYLREQGVLETHGICTECFVEFRRKSRRLAKTNAPASGTRRISPSDSEPRAGGSFGNRREIVPDPAFSRRNG